MVKPFGSGMIVGRIRHFGSCWPGRGGTVQVGTIVLVILTCVLVQRLIVRVSHFVLVMAFALGVTVTVLVAAGIVIVNLFGTEVVVLIVEVAGRESV